MALFRCQSVSVLTDLNFEQALFRDVDDKLRFRYPADDPLMAEVYAEMFNLVREYKGDGEYLNHVERVRDRR